MAAAAIENKEPDDLKIACMFHDCGKPFVKIYDDDGIAHYPNHAGVGAYVYLNARRNLDVAVLIGEHMRMHQKDFRIDRLENQIGKELTDLCRRLKDYDETHA